MSVPLKKVIARMTPASRAKVRAEAEKMIAEEMERLEKKKAK